MQAAVCMQAGVPMSTRTAEPYVAPLGISGVIGAEITLGRFNISYDFKPAVNLRGGEKTFYSQTGVSVRYVAFKRFRPL